MKTKLLYRWACTCPVCPEQYDIWDEDDLIAYFRLRNGQLLVHPYVHSDSGPKHIDWDDVWYKHMFRDKWKGAFIDDKERKRYKRIIEKIIKEKLS